MGWDGLVCSGLVWPGLDRAELGGLGWCRRVEWGGMGWGGAGSCLIGLGGVAWCKAVGWSGLGRGVRRMGVFDNL